MMTITDEQLREILAPVKPRIVTPCAHRTHSRWPRIHPVKLAAATGRFLFDCFDGPGKTVRPFGVSAGGVL